ncbi:MAG: Gfo/Idh/MocA family oxidoreductase, partial [Terracidiphilus sp.]
MTDMASGLFRASSVTRRHFLASAGASIAVASSSRLRAARAAASNRVTVGVVGWGMQGPNNTKAFLKLPNCQVVAACDIETNHLQAALDTINGHYGNKDCASYHDFRELLARSDIDAVMIAVPDHWHAIIAVEA